MNELHKIALNRVIANFQARKQRFKIVNDFVDFSSFRDVTDLYKNPISFNKDIVIVKEIQMLGISDYTLWNNQTTFLKLKSKLNEVDYRHLFTVSNINGNVYEFRSNYPSIHNSHLFIDYDLTTGVFQNVNDVFKASLSYTKVIAL